MMQDDIGTTSHLLHIVPLNAKHESYCPRYGKLTTAGLHEIEGMGRPHKPRANCSRPLQYCKFSVPPMLRSYRIPPQTAQSLLAGVLLGFRTNCDASWVVHESSRGRGLGAVATRPVEASRGNCLWSTYWVLSRTEGAQYFSKGGLRDGPARWRA